MKYRRVCVEAFACTLPEQVVTSAELEARLEPLYRRLRLPEGRLELMTGISARRFWPPETLPSQKSIETGEQAIRLAGIERRRIGALIHGSVCRDYLEPATACTVHRGLGLPEDCLIYDVSNACLGLLDGVVQAANMIELGHTQAALVVGTESSRSLVETTIEYLNRNTALSRKDIKSAFASLTIGSGSAAVLLVDERTSRTGNRLLGGLARANTQFCHLCRNDQDDAVGRGMEPLMWTDSEQLMHEGVATAQRAFDAFLETVGWSRATLDKTICHQVGRAHRKLLFDALGLNPAVDYSTLEWLGNTGSVALPMTAAIAAENGHLAPGDRVGLLGIGSGINVLLLGVEWQLTPAAAPGESTPGRSS